MRKYLIYSAVVILLAGVFGLSSQKPQLPDTPIMLPTVYAQPSSDVIKTDAEVETTEILTDLQTAIADADNVLVNYTYWLELDGLNTEITSLSTLFDRTTNACHAVVINDCGYREIWLNNEKYYTATTDTDWHYADTHTDRVACEEVTSCFRKNLNTVKFILEFLSNEEDIKISGHTDYTYYVGATKDTVLLGNILTSDTSADMKSALFSVKVPSNPSDYYVVKLVVNYVGSSLGITKEEYVYEIQLNTHYGTTIPVGIGGTVDE